MTEEERSRGVQEDHMDRLAIKYSIWSGFQGLCYSLPWQSHIMWVSMCCHETTTPGAVPHKKTSTDTVLKACCNQLPKSAA